MEFAGEIQQRGISGAVIEPENAQHFVLPPIDRPFLEGTFVETRGLIGEIFGHEGHDAKIASGFVILRQDLEHHKVGPPILILGRTDPAGGSLMIQSPVEPLFHLCDEYWVLGEEGEWDQAVKKVRAAFPAFASPAEPTGVRSQIGPKFVQMARESFGLEVEFIEQPAARFYGGEAEGLKSVGR